MKHGNTFPRWLLLSMMLVMLILLAFGTWFYHSQKQRVKQDAEENLQAIAQLKVNQITDWRADQLAEGDELTGSYFFSSGIAQWMVNPTAIETDLILARFHSLQDHYQYHDILLVDAKGQVHLSLSGSLQPIHEEVKQSLTITFRDKKPVLTDLHLDENEQLPHLSVIAPLFSKSGDTTKPIGAVVLRNNARQFLYPLIQSWPTPCRSCETLIVQQEGDSVLFLNDLRFQKNTALTLRIPMTQESFTSVMAVKGVAGIVQGKDYRGVKVLASLKHIPDSPWFMVAKMDEAEAFAVWRFQSILILALMSVFVVASVAAILVIWQRNAKAHYQALFQAEAAQRESEERYRITLLSVGDGVISTDVHGRVDMMNSVAEALTGWRETEAQGKMLEEVFRIINEETRQSVENPVQRVIREGVVVGLANHSVLIAKSGTEYPIADSGAPIRNENGDIIGVVLVFRDQTAERTAQNSLRTREAQLSNAMKIAKLGYWEYDVAKDLFTFNDQFYAIFRTTAEKVGGYTLSSARYAELFVHPDDRSVVGAEVQKAIESTDPHFSRQLEHRVIFADGEMGYITVRFFIVKDDQGRTVKTYGANQDITERKQAEEILADSERKFRTIFNGASDGMFLLDIEAKKFTLSNKSCLQMLGYNQEEFENLDIKDLHSPEELPIIAEQMDILFREGAAPHQEVKFKRKDGSIIYADLSPVLIDLSGRKYALIIFKDITERKRAEAEKEKLQAQLLQAQKMESVGRLAGGVAHDFNNMLGVIIGHAEMAMMQLDVNEPIHQDLQEIFTAAQRSTDLTRQLLAFARKQIILPKVLDLNDIVSGILKMLRRLIGEDINLVWIPGNDVWKVKIDPSQIDQLLANLVVNSRDAITGMGKVTIETDNVVLDEAYCTNHVGFIPGEFILLAVSDDGCGMDKETVSHIFEPFYTTKGVGEGTGLGLATVYGIVKQNEGFINIYSEPGQGTTFKVYLPRFKGDVPEITAVVKDEPLIGGSETVLVVEDEKMIFKLVTRMLERLGYTVIGSDKPEEAIRLAQEYTGEIPLLLTDLIMPGMNGKELAEKLSSIKPGLKTLFMSGYTANVIAHHGVLDEGLKFIQKPFSVKDLARKIRQALE